LIDLLVKMIVRLHFYFYFVGPARRSDSYWSGGACSCFGIAEDQAPF
jgi:hypothetical protein